MSQLLIVLLVFLTFPGLVFMGCAVSGNAFIEVILLVITFCISVVWEIVRVQG